MDEKSFQLSTINYAVLLKSMCWYSIYWGNTRPIKTSTNTDI